MSIDGLVGMLPGLVAGMASQALEDEARRVEAEQRLRDEPVDISMSFQTDAMRSIPEPIVPALAAYEPDPGETAEEIQATFDREEKGVTAKPVRRARKTAAKRTVRKTTARKTTARKTAAAATKKRR
jgi:hypothetical protein